MLKWHDANRRPVGPLPVPYQAQETPGGTNNRADGPVMPLFPSDVGPRPSPAHAGAHFHLFRLSVVQGASGREYIMGQQYRRCVSACCARASIVLIDMRLLRACVRVARLPSAGWIIICTLLDFTGACGGQPKGDSRSLTPRSSSRSVCWELREWHA